MAGRDGMSARTAAAALPLIAVTALTACAAQAPAPAAGPGKGAAVCEMGYTAMFPPPGNIAGPGQTAQYGTGSAGAQPDAPFLTAEPAPATEPARAAQVTYTSTSPDTVTVTGVTVAFFAGGIQDGSAVVPVAPYALAPSQAVTVSLAGEGLGGDWASVAQNFTDTDIPAGATSCEVLSVAAS